MIRTIADLAAALDQDLCAHHRAPLEELALGLLRLRIVQRQKAQLCRLTLDSPAAGGDDDRRDPAAA